MDPSIAPPQRRHDVVVENCWKVPARIVVGMNKCMSTGNSLSVPSFATPTCVTLCNEGRGVMTDFIASERIFLRAVSLINFCYDSKLFKRSAVCGLGHVSRRITELDISFRSESSSDEPTWRLFAICGRRIVLSRSLKHAEPQNKQELTDISVFQSRRG